MTNILIVEDEPQVSSFVQRGLRAAGYETTTADTGARALEEIRAGEYDLVVLDIGLPDMSGLEVLTTLRREHLTVAVIALTARDTVSDLVAGLDSGADDYIPKPFRFDELLARIRTRLRDRASSASTTLESDGLSLDLLTRRVRVGEREVDLSSREFTLAEYFMRHPGQVFNRERLLKDVWGYDFDPGSNLVEVYVRYLRKKLGTNRIETIRGVGYRFR